MYLRIVRWQMLPGKADELERRWNAEFGSAIHQPGALQQLYMGSDPEKNTVAVVSLWESPPDVTQLDRWTDMFATQLADIISGVPTMENFEVMQEVK